VSTAGNIVCPYATWLGWDVTASSDRGRSKTGSPASIDIDGQYPVTFNRKPSESKRGGRRDRTSSRRDPPGTGPMQHQSDRSAKGFQITHCHFSSLLPEIETGQCTKPPGPLAMVARSPARGVSIRAPVKGRCSGTASVSANARFNPRPREGAILVYVLVYVNTGRKVQRSGFKGSMLV
jgi:hypothetical protein